MENQKKSLPFLVISGIVLVVLIGGGVGYFFYQNYQKEQARLKNPTEMAKEEAKNLIAKVGKLVMLPVGEPQIATVADIEKLKDQKFFTNAQNGDQVLIYQEAKKAILYRSSTNMVIEVAPLIINDATASGTSSATPLGDKKELQIALRNGTTTTGLTKILEEELKGKISNITVVERDNANRHYDKTTVIDVTGKAAQVVIDLAKVLSASVSGLPVGETKPTADVLIIIGKDRAK